MANTSKSRPLRWLYLEQYGSDVLCPEGEQRPFVFGTVYRAIDAARTLGGCALGRCLHAPMRWVLLRADDSATDPAPPTRA